MLKKLSLKEFKAIYAKVPRVTVEIIYINKRGYLLTLRAFGPWKGQWHFPGGGILMGESMEMAVKRVAKEELGVEAEVKQFLGIIEWLPNKNSAKIHAYSLCFLVDLKKENIKLDGQASEFNFFKKIPENTITEQKNFIQLENLV